MGKTVSRNEVYRRHHIVGNINFAKIKVLKRRTNLGPTGGFLLMFL